MAKREASDSRATDDTALDELYIGDFDGFVARRNELAKDLRARGDGEAADRVRALKKPSRVAWAINQFSGRGAKLRDELLEAGARLREAQERLVAGKAERADLREASDEEQAAVGRALDTVVALAEEAGSKLSPASSERARQTLHAVALDEDVRLEFERHRLTTEHEAAGLAGFSLGAAAPAPGRGGRARSAKKELKAAEAKAGKLEARQREAEREVEAARKAADQAGRDLRRAVKELDKAAADAEAARQRVEDLRGST